MDSSRRCKLGPELGSSPVRFRGGQQVLQSGQWLTDALADEAVEQEQPRIRRLRSRSGQRIIQDTDRVGQPVMSDQSRSVAGGLAAHRSGPRTRPIIASIWASPVAGERYSTVQRRAAYP